MLTLFTVFRNYFYLSKFLFLLLLESEPDLYRSEPLTLGMSNVGEDQKKVLSFKREPLALYIVPYDKSCLAIVKK